MSADEAEDYHTVQIRTFAETAADMVCAITMNYSEEAIERVDDATSGAPAYYMINCAHPSHFSEMLPRGATFVERIRGLRANASRMSHAELNDAQVLDDGFPDELAAEYARIRHTLRNLNVMGGCCGTDHRHVEAIARACISSF